jgi:hypothetical protein
VDPDAQAFITAAAITDPTQQSAVNQLVVDLKGYGVWTKMKALYPFVGGTASQHKFNLKDPRDLDVAFRLVFNGGWTHSASGAQPNGTNGYADTKVNENSVLSLNNQHLSIYSRTNVDGLFCDIGVNTGVSQESNIFAKYLNAFYPRIQNTNNGIANTGTSQGLFVSNRTNSTQVRAFQNGVLKLITNNSLSKSSANIFIGASSVPTGANLYSPRQYAFASIGDGLTDTEAANFYTAVQTFQTTLGRSIGTQTVSDADAQAFVTNAGIVDQVEANAINNLVIGMKADGVWSKMKAIYPFVGGTASTHKFNLKNPLDTDAAFRLTFHGGITHSSTGMVGNATNGYADTKFITGTNFTSSTSKHLSFYLRTNNVVSGDPVDMGSIDSGSALVGNDFLFNGNSNNIGGQLSTTTVTSATTDRKGFSFITKNGTSQSVWKNGTKLNTTSGTGDSSGELPVWLCGISLGSSSTSNFFPYGPTNNQFAFASLGDGLNDTEATNLNTRVTTFQTALSRNV